MLMTQLYVCVCVCIDKLHKAHPKTTRVVCACSVCLATYWLYICNSFKICFRIIKELMGCFETKKINYFLELSRFKVFHIITQY